MLENVLEAVHKRGCPTYNATK